MYMTFQSKTNFILNYAKLLIIIFMDEMSTIKVFTSSLQNIASYAWLIKMKKMNL